MLGLPISAKEIADLLESSRKATEASERQAAALERIATALETHNKFAQRQPV